MDIKPGTVSQTTASQAVSTAERQTRPGAEGKLLTALVASSTLLPPLQASSTGQGQSQTLFEILLKSDGNQITTRSTTHFIPGQLLSIEVLPDSSIRVLEILSSPVAQQNERVQQGLREALPLQQKIDTLLNNLVSLRPLLSQLPQSPELQRAIIALDLLLSGIQSPQQLRQPANLITAMRNSGTLLESNLRAMVTQLATSTRGKPAPDGAALNAPMFAPQTQTKQTTAHASITQTTQASPQNSPTSIITQLEQNPNAIKEVRALAANDFKAQLLKLTRELLPLLPEKPLANTLPPAASSATSATALIAKIVAATNDLVVSPALKLPVELSNRMSLAPADISLNMLSANAPQANATASTAAERFDLAVSTVLRQLAATIAKVQHHQLNALTQTAAPDSPIQQNWQLTIPLYFEQQVKTIEINIERRLEGGTADEQPDQGIQWHVTLGFDWGSYGVFYATLRVIQQAVSTTFWSEQPATLERIQDKLDVLRAALQDLGLEVQTLDCRSGTPAITHSRLDQQLVDIRT